MCVCVLDNCQPGYCWAPSRGSHMPATHELRLGGVSPGGAIEPEFSWSALYRVSLGLTRRMKSVVQIDTSEPRRIKYVKKCIQYIGVGFTCRKIRALRGAL